MFQIARNACYDVLKRQQRLENLDRVDDTVTTEVNTDAIDRSTAVSKALQRISAEQREAILLCDMAGYSYQEIAEITGASLSNVKVRIFRGREKLRGTLTSEGIEP